MINDNEISPAPTDMSIFPRNTGFKLKLLVTYNEVISQLDNITLYGSDFRICIKTNLISYSQQIKNITRLLSSALLFNQFLTIHDIKIRQ